MQPDPTARADMSGLPAAWGSSNTKLGDMSRVDKLRTELMTPAATRTNEPSATIPTTSLNSHADASDPGQSSSPFQLRPSIWKHWKFEDNAQNIADARPGTLGYRPSPKNLAQDKKAPEVKLQQTGGSGLAAEEPIFLNTAKRKSDTMESTLVENRVVEITASNLREVESNDEPTILDAADRRRRVAMTSGSGVHVERPLATCLPLAPSASTGREVVTQEGLGHSLLAQSMTTNSTESLSTVGAEEQISPTGYILPLNSAVRNSGGSTPLEETQTWVDGTTGKSHSTEEIRGPRSTLPSDTCGSLDGKTSSADQSTGIAESKEIPTLITTADSSYSTKPTSDAISANMFSNAQNMTILGGSYNLNIYPPHRDGSDIDVSSDNNEFPLLIVSEERLGKHFRCSTFTANVF